MLCPCLIQRPQAIKELVQASVLVLLKQQPQYTLTIPKSLNSYHANVVFMATSLDHQRQLTIHE